MSGRMEVQAVFARTSDASVIRRRLVSTNTHGVPTRLVTLLFIIVASAAIGAFHPQLSCAKEPPCDNLGSLPNPPDNIPDLTKAALARAWKQPCSEQKLLK